MKKAKMMLVAVAVVGVVGGAFAFKASKFISKVVYTFDGISACTVPVIDATTVPTPTPLGQTLLTTDPALSCVDQVYYQTVNQ